MLADGTASLCYRSKEELDALREQQIQQGIKPRYDGRWRPEVDKHLPMPPAGVPPVVRFKNPDTGVVAWDDLVKGRIEIANAELDDLIIARADGTPTYNFCVVVDDWDMQISHVIRGDDHVNNTPRQINMLKALGANIPQYAHLSMILGDDGQKLSKRHGAVSVMQYDEEGYLPEAVLNYLARLGWSHGDEEVFSMQQFCEWFDLDHITPSAAQFNTEKLNWLNAHYIKACPMDKLMAETSKRLQPLNIYVEASSQLAAAIQLYRERANNLNQLAQDVAFFFAQPQPNSADVEKHITPEAISVMTAFVAKLSHLDWAVEAIHAVMNEVVAEQQIKFPKLAMPLRVMLTGGAQSPSIDQVMYILGREVAIQRINAYLS
jgi:glutamyl-tRNA synthetase